MDAAQVLRWSGRLDDLSQRIKGCFGRSELRSRASAYLRGLLGPVQRKNSWQLAEYMGAATPHGFQRLLGRASWDADALRDEVRRYATEYLLAEGESGVLIVDETGFLKKGDKSAGVQRQYSGTAGRIDNCQVGVFLGLVGSRGRALIDRALYLPKAWCDDRDRLRQAGVPPQVGFATKPQLARAMLGRALDTSGGGLRAKWVLGDAVYGSDYKTRQFLESHGQPYVMAVTSQQRLWVNLQQKRVDAIAGALPPEAWFTMSIGQGAKGPRVYEWTAGAFGAVIEHERGDLQHWLLVRRSPGDPTDRAYYFCVAPPDAAPQDLAIAAGQRWAIETCFQTAKQEAGLDEYEVRSWVGWHRHVTLSMLALAFLAAVRAQANQPREKGAIDFRGRWPR